MTGASSGLGRAFSVALAQRGAEQVLTGRSETRLAETCRLVEAAGGAPPRTVVADLTEADARRRVVEATAERFDGRLDLVIQAAGVGAYGRFLSHHPDVLRRLLDVNFIAVAELARELFPLLRAGRRPAMVIIGSIVARRALPGRSEYSASKHALAAWVDAVRCEWAGAGIHLLLVNPGFTRTSFERHLIVDTAFVKAEHRRSMTPEQVTRATLRALDRRRAEITLTASGRLLLMADRLMPALVRAGLARWTRRLYAQHQVYDEPAQAPQPERLSGGSGSPYNQDAGD
ncbi:MAG: glucose dehydrogenase [Isosphaeraceae bacterium]|nr:MAG: glucose dehydrogenase [Isosphaeraceae bacterium]